MAREENSLLLPVHKVSSSECLGQQTSHENLVCSPVTLMLATPIKGGQKTSIRRAAVKGPVPAPSQSLLAGWRQIQNGLPIQFSLSRKPPET